ncbi:MAG: hypothetical protein COB17_02390 [Sulfurimonas sp.]|nr:MAG: hypothetical protein COB17_02390 [Sulfurimonas sp.]
MKKPNFVSHYLVLSDLLENVDVRAKSDIIFYLTGRIENVKCDIKSKGVEFVEDATKESTYSHYKPYILVATTDNLYKAKELLKSYATDEVLSFLEQKPNIDIVNHEEVQGSY